MSWLNTVQALVRDSSRTMAPERCERLLAIRAPGVWLLATQGLATIERGQQSGPSSAPKTRIELSTIRIGQELARNASGRSLAILRATAARKSGDAQKVSVLTTGSILE